VCIAYISLEYLSSQQALADLARLLAHLKQSLGSPDSQVITVGGSYSGNLAAWFSVKYPSLAQGSVASSGPILAETNFTQYMDVVAESLAFFEGQGCVDSLQVAAEAVALLAAQGGGSPGYSQLDTDFATCTPLGSSQDLSILLSDLMGYVQGTVQYNRAKPGSFNISTVCAVMLDTSADQSSYDQFVALAAMYRADYGLPCEDASWADTVAYLGATQNDGDNSGRPWTYQTCNEFGYYQTTDSMVSSVVV
jgi:pimeloyl-ACP methyl ester carboxylesterase